jgi:hypothetical protein
VANWTIRRGPRYTRNRSIETAKFDLSILQAIKKKSLRRGTRGVSGSLSSARIKEKRWGAYRGNSRERLIQIVTVKVDRLTRFTRQGGWDSLRCRINFPDPNMIDSQAKERFEPLIAEFRREIARHRAEGATEAQIKELLGASIWLALQGVDDRELRTWVCEQFGRAASVAPIVTSYPLSGTLH